ncbi:hypothetical protein CJ030_MR5G010224 [Morella rubra]|uniref:Uncharacterized protein n=1 Tax=Morella rubra TaxID=262757 RepID=A0A6A1VJF3_9ROSI|nr:hypothetical protein CJ030_MR5G010224 [Morella rubra]
MPRTKHAAMVGNERAGSSRSSADHSGEPDYFFRNPECAEKFYNDFSKRKVMLGRKVNVESLSDFEIERPFVKQGWRNLLDMGTEVFPKYVRLFFANMTVGWEAGEEVTFMDVFVIERLLKEKKFNLPYIMLKHMEAACESKKNLPYGLLFTQIFRYFGVALSSRERDTLTKCEQFDATVLTRMGYRRTSRNTWVPKRQDSDEDEGVAVAEAEDEPEGEEVDADLADDPPIIPSLPEFPTLPSSFDTRFTAFEARMTAMHEAQNKFIQESFTSMQEEQRQFFAEMRTFMARFPPP